MNSFGCCKVLIDGDIVSVEYTYNTLYLEVEVFEVDGKSRDQYSEEYIESIENVLQTNLYITRQGESNEH